MVLGSHRYRKDRNPTGSKKTHNIVDDLEDNTGNDLDKARDKFNKAQEEYYAALRNQHTYHKPAEGPPSTAKIILKSAGKLVNGFFDANMRISDPIERDIRRHSLQGQIDNTIIDSLMSKGKSSSKKSTKRTDKVTIVYIDGKPVIVPVKDIDLYKTTRRRR
jgi:hypothetical protein